MTRTQLVAGPDSLFARRIAVRQARLDSTVAQLVRLRSLVAQTSDAALVEAAIAEAGAALGQLRQVRGVDDFVDAEVGTSIVKAGDVTIASSNDGNLQTRAKGYVSADFGFAYSAPLSQVLAYAGANFYLRPVNRDVPLPPFFGRTRDRISINVGIVLTKVAKAGERDGLLGDASVLVGGGYRVFDWVRLGAGVVLFRANDPANLTGTGRVISGAWYVSLSIDQELKDLVGGLFSPFK